MGEKQQLAGAHRSALEQLSGSSTQVAALRAECDALKAAHSEALHAADSAKREAQLAVSGLWGVACLFVGGGISFSLVPHSFCVAWLCAAAALLLLCAVLCCAVLCCAALCCAALCCGCGVGVGTARRAACGVRRGRD